MKRKKYFKKFLGILLVAAMSIGSVQPPVAHAQNNEAQVETVLTVSGNDAWDGETLEAVYEKENYRVTFTLAGYWQGGYSADIRIENVGDSTIENWCVQFPLDGTITNIWNGEISKQENGTCTIKNVDWNQDIAVGQSVSFGFTGGNDFVGFPTEYILIGESAEKQQEDYAVEYVVYSDWGSGFTGEISITNNTDVTLEDWVLEFDFNRSIDSIWNAVMTSCENNHYIIANAGYNADVQAGGTVSFGFLGMGGSSEEEPYSFRLYTYDGSADNAGGGETQEPEPGESEDEIPKEEVTEPSEDMDTDGDGILDEIEKAFGLDYTLVDTDGDDLTDYEELYEVLTDPLDEDTDGDGIPDAEEKIYQTVTEDLRETGSQGVNAVSVSLSTAGNAQETIRITNLYGNDTLSNNVVGRIGVPVEIQCTSEFETADIVFHYDRDALGETREDDLAILWYNEENGWYEILDQGCVIDKESQTVTYTTTHFSTYLLIDGMEWYSLWETDIALVEEAEGSEYDTLSVEIDGSLHWYQIFENHGTWKEAEEICARAGGYLATIQSDEENAVVYEYMKSQKCESAYIGLSDEEQEGVWKWSNGEEVTYTNWYTGEPNGNRGENYAMFYYKFRNGRWNDGAFNLGNTVKDVSLFICEWDNVDLETDSDGDGLPDYYENCGIKCSDGQIYYTDPYDEDTDDDGLTDFEETGSIHVGKQYIGKGEKRTVKYYKLTSNPLKEDSDGDGLTDEEEIYYYGTGPLQTDSDYDGLSDYMEIMNWFNPLEADEDGDGRLDLQEYQEGTSPYSYDKDWKDYIWEFGEGFIKGDFIEETDSVATMMGQVTSSYIPLVDLRDVLGNLYHKDYTFAGLSAFGLVIGLGDASKTVGKIAKFAIKNIDDLPTLVRFFDFLSKNCPELVKQLSKSDEFADAMKQLVNADTSKLTKSEMESWTNFLKEAGVAEDVIKGGTSTIKSSDLVFGSSTKSTQKLMNQMNSRGWTEDLIRNTVDNPYTIRTSVNKATGNSATVFYTQQGSYVIVDDVTKAIVQISDNINPSTWAPDLSIVDPYIPD